MYLKIQIHSNLTRFDSKNHIKFSKRHMTPYMNIQIFLVHKFNCCTQDVSVLSVCTLEAKRFHITPVYVRGLDSEGFVMLQVIVS